MEKINKECGCGKHNCGEQHKCACPMKLNGACGGCASNIVRFNIEDLSERELYFIEELKQYFYLPICSVTLENPIGEKKLFLSSVFIESENEELENILDSREALNKLIQKRFIEADFNNPLINYNYNEYIKWKEIDEIKAAYPESKVIINKGSMKLRV